MTLKVLIADKLAPEGPDLLRQGGEIDVAVQTDLSGNNLIDALRQSDGIVVRSATKLTKDIIESCMSNGQSRLKAIARAGVGVDNIDVDAATRFGIAVMNSASASTITTAEHAFALMIALSRNIAPAHATMSAGGWDRNKFIGSQLHGRTLAVVGFGRIGQTLARRALAFGMNVIAFDPLINAQTALDGAVKLFDSVDEVFPLADFVSFHVPKTETTTGMLNRDRFSKLKKGALIVNAARGGIVDEDALLEAVNSGQCGGAALDVFDKEPPAKDCPLRNHPKILLTPHLGASTIEAQEAVAVDACRALLHYLRGEGLEGAVNAGGLQMDLSDRQKTFVDLASRMVKLLRGAVGELSLTEVEFITRGASLAARADTISRFTLAELLAASLDQPVNVINAPLIADERHIKTSTHIETDTGEDRLGIEIKTKRGSHRAEGAIFEDGMPRVLHLDGYHMDMVPAGNMVILTNEDQPGRIGLVGNLFGDAGINIAEMVIARKPAPNGSGQIAMMILKLDGTPTKELLDELRKAKGILTVAEVSLGQLAK